MPVAGCANALHHGEHATVGNYKDLRSLSCQDLRTGNGKSNHRGRRGHGGIRVSESFCVSPIEDAFRLDSMLGKLIPRGLNAAIHCAALSFSKGACRSVETRRDRVSTEVR